MNQRKFDLRALHCLEKEKVALQERATCSETEKFKRNQNLVSYCKTPQPIRSPASPDGWDFRSSAFA